MKSLKFKNNNKSTRKITEISIKFLLLVMIILLLLTATRFQYFFYVIDNYLTLITGWGRLFVYLFLIGILLMIISNNYGLINARKIFLSLIIMISLLYFITNMFQLVNSDYSEFWKRESFTIFKIKFNNFINEYDNFIKKNLKEIKLGFLLLPWINCQTGILGISIISLTNYVGNSVSIVLSYFILFYLLMYFISSKVPRIFFSINYFFLKGRKYLLNFFKKSKYIVYKNDKYFLRYFKSRITINYQEIFNNEKFYQKKWKLTGKKNNFQGIYAIYVDNFYGKEKVFLPCYIGKSNNIVIRWKSHCEKIKWAYKNPNDLSKTLAVYQRIAAYLHVNNLTPKDLKFIVLEWVKDNKKVAKCEAYWINKIGTTQRGWNSIRA